MSKRLWKPFGHVVRLVRLLKYKTLQTLLQMVMYPMCIDIINIHSTSPWMTKPNWSFSKVSFGHSMFTEILNQSVFESFCRYIPDIFGSLHLYQYLCLKFLPLKANLNILPSCSDLIFFGHNPRTHCKMVAWWWLIPWNHSKGKYYGNKYVN